MFTPKEKVSFLLEDIRKLRAGSTYPSNPGFGNPYHVYQFLIKSGGTYKACSPSFLPCQ
jgi:hypothetical protein